MSGNQMGCGPSGAIFIESELTDDEGLKVGMVHGIVYPDWHSLSAWLTDRGATPATVSALKRTTDIYPIAVLSELSVDMDRRGSGHGKVGMRYFYESAVEEDARASVVIVDTTDVQRDGFEVMIWMKRNGYVPLGYTRRGETLMFRRYDG